MDFLKEIKNRILIYDGSKGFMLQTMGLKGGECPELWNVTHPEQVKEVYRQYKNAGADVIQTNTFQGNRLKLKEYSLDDRTHELNYEGVRLAREVMGRDGYVSVSIGPIGKLLEPFGELTFEQAYDLYAEQVKAADEAGADIINFETFTDLAEMRAAYLAARENCSLPIICSMSFEKNGRTLMGSDPYITALVLKSLGADVIGTNCSMGPSSMVEIVKNMASVGNVYISIKPNAGIPEVIDGKTVYSETPESFSKIAPEFINAGARLIGGCCGTTPSFISAVKQAVANSEPVKVIVNCDKIISSDVKMLNLDKNKDYTIGKIDATQDQELSNELSQGNIDYITDLLMDINDDGCDALLINAGQAEKVVLVECIKNIQTYSKIPVIIEAAEPEALKNALRIYRGKAGVVIKNEGNMEQLLAAAKKYGSTIIEKTDIK